MGDDEPLRVDTPRQPAAAGGRLEGLASAISLPPAVFSPPGADPLSMAIAGKVAEVVSPAVAALPGDQGRADRYAQNVLNAAGAYDNTDRQIAEEILRRLGELDSASGGTGGGTPGGGAAGGASSSAGMAGSPFAGAGQQAGQLGQMMGMPMQMAQQAAQIPLQMMGMAAAVPQGIMQGVQSAMQQVGQMSDMAGKDEQNPDGGEEDKQEDPSAGKKPEETPPRTGTRACPPRAGGAGQHRRRARHQSDRSQAQPGVPAAPRPAPTRPAESSPEIAVSSAFRVTVSSRVAVVQEAGR